jgi:hypothetical protein
MRRLVVSLAGGLAVCFAGCDPEVEVEPEPTPGIGALGHQTHSLDNVTIDTIATRDNGLRGPRDLDFNPAVPGELWVVNQTDRATITISATGTNDQQSVRRLDPANRHFLDEVSSLSFGDDMKFATCQESRNGGNDFMGPSLWSADPAIFALSNPEAVLDNGGGDLGSHLDMLHESPLCMGIAWVKEDFSCCGNVYYAFEGLTGTIARYDFDEDHGPGFDYHGDGIIERFTDVEVSRVAGIPSHMVHDHDTGLLYIADTGNNRVMVLDTDTAESVRTIRGFETLIGILEGATFVEFISAEEGEFQAPSGIALHDGVLYVADNITSRISAWDLSGNLLDYLDLDLPEGSLMGLRAHADGSLYATDFRGNRVLRLRAK